MCFRSIALVAFALTSQQTGAPEPALGRPFDVKAAEVATIQGLHITFEGVSDDSRCPRGAQCVWAGDATVAVTLRPPKGAAD